MKTENAFFKLHKIILCPRIGKLKMLWKIKAATRLLCAMIYEVATLS